MVLAHQQPNSIFFAVNSLVDMLAKDGFKEDCGAVELAAVCRDPAGVEGGLEKGTGHLIQCVFYLPGDWIPF